MSFSYYTFHLFTVIQVGGEDVLLVTPRESLVFPATDYLRQVIVQTCTTRELHSTVVIDGYHVTHIDSTMAKVTKTSHSRQYTCRYRFAFSCSGRVYLVFEEIKCAFCNQQKETHRVYWSLYNFMGCCAISSNALRPTTSETLCF